MANVHHGRKIELLMKCFIRLVLCLTTILCYSLAYAEPVHDESSTLNWELEDAPKVIRSPPVTHGSTSGNKFSGFVKVDPVKKDGLTIGYRITLTEQGVLLFSKYGLVSGDVVTMINGIELTNRENAIGALRKVVKAPSIDLEVIRNGVKVRFSISLE